MKNNFTPKSYWGKWSVGLTIFFLLLITVFFIFFLFGSVTFNEGHWWDWTVGISILLVISAFITGIIAIKKNKDYSILVCVSMFIVSSAILFLLLHSLIISD
jgi:hypothetical protein